MGGRMGSDQVSLTNLEIMKVEAENNLIYIKGAVPGARNGLLLIQAPGEIKTVEPVSAPQENPEPKQESLASEVVETLNQESVKAK